MLRSMTGYGRSGYAEEDTQVEVIVRSLNAKYLDISLRFPVSLEDHEGSCRHLIAQYMSRGKVSVSINLQDLRPPNASYEIHEDTLQRHYQKLNTQFADKTHLQAVLSGLLSLPGLVTKQLQVEKVPVWTRVETCVREALEACKQMQEKEGQALTELIRQYSAEIKRMMNEVEAIEPLREARLREKLQKRMDKWIEAARYSKERMEEEMLYYLERMSFEEEKARLIQHLALLEESLALEHAEAKKLSFITQEIARELNTLGAKAADADIQQRVVDMKNELEKIREQLLNTA